MKIRWIALFLLFTLTAGCSMQAPKEPARSFAKPVQSQLLVLDGKGIIGIALKDLQTNQQTEYTAPGFLQEFIGFLQEQQYTPAEKMPEDTYEVQLLDSEQKPVLVLKVSGRWIDFSKDIMIGPSTLRKGTYELEHWIDSKMRKFYEGAVLSPAYLQYPAKLTMPDEVYSAELIDRGSTRVNAYEVIPRMYELIDTCFNRQTFEITGGRILRDSSQREAEIAAAQEANQCIAVSYGDSGTYMQAQTDGPYAQWMDGSNSLLVRTSDGLDSYRLITQDRAMELKVTEDFHEKWSEIFAINRERTEHLTPQMIKEIFHGQKPHWMDFICKNLGVASSYGNEYTELKESVMKLDASGNPYSLLSFYNPSYVVIFIFKQDQKSCWQFVDTISFGGWVTDNQYHIEKAGEQIWIVGDRCRGHGTGVSRHCQEWYTVSEKGAHMAISFPYDDYLGEPDGGYGIQAEKIHVNKKGKIEIIVDYKNYRYYNMELPMANEYGQVKVEGKKQVVFCWNSQEGRFTAEGYVPDEYGVTPVSPDCSEITQKCDEILKNNYDAIQKMIQALPGEKDENIRSDKATGAKKFLNDCTDSSMKQELIKLLADVM